MTFPEDFLGVVDGRGGKSKVRTEVPGGSMSSNEMEISSPLDVRDIADVMRSPEKPSRAGCGAKPANAARATKRTIA
jgi:hypothetical protein